MTRVGIAELKARLSEYLMRVKAGEEILVSDRGRPVTRLVPITGRGGLRGRRPTAGPATARL